MVSFPLSALRDGGRPCQATFIDRIVDLVLREGFDGLDIDWEYPTRRGGAPADKVIFMNIMTYDYHGAFENFTHHNAPLCAYPSDEGNFDYFNELGIPPEKSVTGIPLYGWCLPLDNIEEHGMLDDASRPSKPGPYTRLPGTLGWNEVPLRIMG
ncbi:hypothetical protein HAZT_HAZT007547 [Hyalella azteca]|uniref:GH18 domain-containing protein n=1 Tax=Hyalella azteca TaxID=294128 RepID=A0A6A0H675_HYAAZ|nr:hypothetical protein HAZT_HAZT007547 [Hyalella azteca]